MVNLIYGGINVQCIIYDTCKQYISFSYAGKSYELSFTINMQVLCFSVVEVSVKVVLKNLQNSFGPLLCGQYVT